MCVVFSRKRGLSSNASLASMGCLAGLGKRAYLFNSALWLYFRYNSSGGNFIDRSEPFVVCKTVRGRAVLVPTPCQYTAEPFYFVYTLTSTYIES